MIFTALVRNILGTPSYKYVQYNDAPGDSSRRCGAAEQTKGRISPHLLSLLAAVLALPTH
jgi:hypothetical protein